jgi:hypothetical protein
MFVCSECCVLSGRGLCDELISHQEESYRQWCVVVCDLETSSRRRPWTALGRRATRRKRKWAADRRGPDILQQFDSLYNCSTVGFGIRNC